MPAARASDITPSQLSTIRSNAPLSNDRVPDHPSGPLSHQAMDSHAPRHYFVLDLCFDHFD